MFTLRAIIVYYIGLRQLVKDRGAKTSWIRRQRRSSVASTPTVSYELDAATEVFTPKSITERCCITGSIG